MTNRTFIIEVKDDNIKVNKYGDKLHSLIDDLWMGVSTHG